jgi:hypothetical protein
VHGHVRAGLGQRNGDARAQPARRTGYQSDLTVEFEFIEYQWNSGPFSSDLRAWLARCTREQNREYTRPASERNA